ncbi:hypothetical protein L1049_007315 [Liquidambar formosana]|uniref:Mitochondrial substrate carrier family protein n=1 Tax=Liquidambar formosana TaxID=63359 RepID=A0AAP0RIL2_LIQFO
MAGSSQPPRSDQPSIKYRWSPLEGASFGLADFVHEEYAPTLSDNNKQSSKKSEPKSSETLSTAELVSAVGQIWDYASRPLAVLQPKANLKDTGSGCWKEDILGILGAEENGSRPTSADSKYFCVDLRTASNSSPMVQPKFFKATQKMSVVEPWSDDYTRLLLWRFLQDSTNMSNESWRGKGLASVGISYELGNIYGWMSQIIPGRLKYPVNITKMENKKTGELCIQGDTFSPAGGTISGVTNSPANNLATGSANCNPDSIKHSNSSPCDTAKCENNKRATTSLYSDYFLRSVKDIEADGSVSRVQSSSLYADYHINSLASCSSAYEESQHGTDGDELLENRRKQPEKYAVEDEPKTEICSPAHDKPRIALAKQEHALAGALAGVCVSLCLHPVDTIKTVIQSCRADQKSICYIGQSIVSQRGLTGLYRGIASNIASSAPISAVYTFTYESVKGALLPLLPKDYHSFAHCMAGGCASIATSFIFTPSERIKQQMQVGSHYQNCWNALVGIIGKGGLPSLYTGWGAVLCRNVPHSIIKFYTYESLKQLMLSSLQSNAQLNTAQTLVCGGLAGSTAALFTTPFDVVKTRLQTQIPGSVSQYDSVFHALKEIGKHEGLKGLYRGLTPRLVMYISQGALFFASYELFKRSFSLEVPQHNAQAILHRQSMKDDSTTLPSPLASVSS